jgi:hypothetical protein
VLDLLGRRGPEPDAPRPATADRDLVEA